MNAFSPGIKAGPVPGPGRPKDTEFVSKSRGMSPSREPHVTILFLLQCIVWLRRISLTRSRHVRPPHYIPSRS